MGVGCKNARVRRRPDTLLPLEVSILEVLASRAADGAGPVHGFELARAIAEAEEARSLTAHGTLYKALSRLARAGFVASRWEDPDEALAAGRPRRRLYEIEDAGARALASSDRADSVAAYRPGRPLAI
jgi:PadR family transcriptional regulator, regulatory protein PadR